MQLDTIAREQADNARDELLAVGKIAEPSTGGEWDGFHALSAPERRRILTRWVLPAPYGVPLDVATEAVGGWDRWLALSRIADAPSQARAPANRGKLDAVPSLGGLGIRQLLATVEMPDIDEPASFTGELVGLSEIASMLDRSLQTVSSWHRRGHLPRPVAVLAMGSVWHAGDVLAWAADKGIARGPRAESVETF